MAEFALAAPFTAPVRGFVADDASVAPAPPRWLSQVHGAGVADLSTWRPGVEADAAWTGSPRVVAAVLTADCVPVLIAEPGGACVAAIHAGWRGLAAGVIPAALEALPVPGSALEAWIGPCIRQPRYEVGPEVRDALPGHESAFRPGRGDRWYADLAAIAAGQLAMSGVGAIDDCRLCTATDPRLPSHRAGRSAARIATMIWIEP